MGLSNNVCAWMETNLYVDVVLTAVRLTFVPSILTCLTCYLFIFLLLDGATEKIVQYLVLHFFQLEHFAVVRQAVRE